MKYNNTKIALKLEFAGFDTTTLTNIQKEKKEGLTRHDVCALRYRAFFLMFNGEIMEQATIDSHNAMQDNALQLNDFEGVQLTDDLILEYIYLDKLNFCYGAIYCESKDKFYYCIID